MFTGAMVALITPFHEGEIDFETLDELIEFHLENGIDAIVPVGTTGESPTLSFDEHKQVIERVVKGAGGSVPVIADMPYPASVRRFDVPFLHLVMFFLKAVLAAIPALILLTAILWVAGSALQSFLPDLVKMKVLISFPN